MFILNPDFGVRFMSDEIIIFDKKRSSYSEIYKFSDSAKLIVEELLNDSSIDEIINKIVTIYNVDILLAKEDLELFILDLVENRIFVKK